MRNFFARLERAIVHISLIVVLLQCNYIVYWRRYARFLEAALGANEARRVWERAMGQLLRRRPDPYLDYALLQESQGQHAVARELYKYVLNFGTFSHPEQLRRCHELTLGLQPQVTSKLS